MSSQSTSAANFSTTLLASADTPLYEIGFRLDTAGVALLTGFAVDSLTVLLDPSQTPLVVVGPRENLYLHRWSLTNANNGEVLTVTWPGALNQKLTVDADAGQVSYALPGYHPRAAVSTDVPRRAWLELEAGSNALGWADAQQGSGQLTLNARWRNRKI